MNSNHTDAAVLVFNRTQAALDELIRMCAPVDAMRAVVASWLADPSVEFLLLISTGGRQSQTATLGARDVDHLMDTVLPDVLTLIDETAVASSMCTSLDPSLKPTLHARWSMLVTPHH